MTTLETVGQFLEGLAPLRTAEEWDNVGLLVGDRQQPLRRIMTCLTITPTTAAEAIQREADLIVSHHPLPFRPLTQLTSDTTTGSLLLELIASRIAVYSLHTAFDSADAGINQQLALVLGLRQIGALVTTGDSIGAGRWGRLESPLRLADMIARIKQQLGIEHVQVVGDPERMIATLAIACGAADEFLAAARRLRCDAMLLGEARFHTCLEAEAAGMALILPGHYSSERFGLERLADLISRQFPELEVWASQQERDPIQWR